MYQYSLPIRFPDDLAIEFNRHPPGVHFQKIQQSPDIQPRRNLSLFPVHFDQNHFRIPALSRSGVDHPPKGPV